MKKRCHFHRLQHENRKQKKMVLYADTPHRYSFNNLRHPPLFIRRHKLITKVIECRNRKCRAKKKINPKAEKKNTGHRIFARSYHRKRHMKEAWLPWMLLNTVHLLQIYTLWISRLLIIIMSSGKHTTAAAHNICMTVDDVHWILILFICLFKNNVFFLCFASVLSRLKRKVWIVAFRLQSGKKGLHRNESERRKKKFVNMENGLSKVNECDDCWCICGCRMHAQ